MDVAALAISIFALAVAIVALPTVFQMFWGGPQVRFDFTEIDGSDGRRLDCQISSAPIESRILRRLGVRREPAIISAQFRICEAGSNHIMLDTAQASLIDVAEWRGQGSFRATITDHLPVSFLCAFHGDDGGRAIAADPLTRASTALPPGRYRVDIDVTCGQRLFSHRQEMTVGERPIFTYWYRI
jgi:hypothetical protein